MKFQCFLFYLFQMINLKVQKIAFFLFFEIIKLKNRRKLMDTNTPASSGILKEIRELYMLALEKGNFSVALKAQEILGRELGFTQPKSEKEKIDLNDLSDDDISNLIMILEAKLKLDHPGHAE